MLRRVGVEMTFLLSTAIVFYAIVFGIPVMFVVLTVVWPVLLYRQIKKELADAD